MPQMTVIEAIRAALFEEMANDSRVLVMGEDIGRLGGVFRATDGLLDRFGPERVVDTPMAELSIAGIAVGLAMKGLRPVAEIQFADFIHAAADHILGEAAKIRYRSAGDWSCPLVVRTAYGAGFRGGPYHSQSVEAFYTHAPGLKVLAPSTPADAKGLLLAAIRDPDPVLFLEHKRTYRLIKGEVPEGNGAVPIGCATIARQGTDVTVVSYGMMLHESLAAAEMLSNEGISSEVIDLRTLIPLDRATILASLSRTGRFCIVHEDTRTMGFGAELAALAVEEALDVLKAPVCRVTMPDVGGIPVSPPMEDFVLPNRDKIAGALRQLVAKQTRRWMGADLPQVVAPLPSLDPWTRSALEIPQAASVAEVDLSKVIAYQEVHRDEFQERGVELNVTAFVLQAVAEALVALPEVNSAFEGECIRRYKSVDILLEVASGDALRRGIIAEAETRNLRGLAQAVSAIQADAAASTLPGGGTFTLTDLGTEAALLAVPPVLPGQAAALRVGAVTERIIPRKGSLVLIPHAYLTLSVDHRVLDGATAGLFLNHIKTFLEQYPTTK
ncbi:MAG TPA: pyruvate dehydrogenase complex E1 component subunit beta [Ktedonobacteraceae bacterium]